MYFRKLNSTRLKLFKTFPLPPLFCFEKIERVIHQRVKTAEFCQTLRENLLSVFDASALKQSHFHQIQSQNGAFFDVCLRFESGLFRF